MNGAIQFDWDEGNKGHIARHGITPEEVEQVLSNDPLDVDARYVGGEERLPSVGVTNAGRWLVVVATVHGDKVRVVTAYEASKRLVEMYLKEKDRV